MTGGVYKKLIYNVAIIGAGQLGSRHLQGLAKSTKKLQVYVVDPDEEALSVAELRYQEAADLTRTNNISYHQDIIELSAALDLVIIATTANVRRAVIESLLEQKTVKYLILEKVVFQNSNDFLPIQALFNKVGTRAWVNCTRRSYLLYKRLKKAINGQIVKITIKGCNWGMACNGIHMIDLLIFLTGQTDIKFDVEHLDNNIYPSKREGYKELRGKLIISTGRGDILEMFDRNSFGDDPEINIATNRIKFIINESKGLMVHQSDMGTQENDITIPFQSELTGQLSDQIIDTGQSDLTPYTECMQYHIPMLDALNEQFSKVKREVIQICPIT